MQLVSPYCRTNATLSAISFETGIFFVTTVQAEKITNRSANNHQDFYFFTSGPILLISFTTCAVETAKQIQADGILVAYLWLKRVRNHKTKCRNYELSFGSFPSKDITPPLLDIPTFFAQWGPGVNGLPQAVIEYALYAGDTAAG